MSDDERGPVALAPETRMPGTVRANRILITLVGVLMAVVGVAVVAIGVGLLLPDERFRPILGPRVDDVVADPWFWPVAAVVAAVIALLALRWLLAQVSSNRVHTIALEEDGDEGRTRLQADALTTALVHEIESYRGVDRAHAHFSGTASRPRLSLTVLLDGRADVAEIHQRVAQEAVAHARTALANDHVPTRLELQVSRRPARDLR